MSDTIQESLEGYYKASEDFLLRNIAGEYVLIPVGGAAEQWNGMVTLNESFQFLWECFKEPHTIAEVVEMVQEEYEAEEDVIRQDVERFVYESILYGFITKEETGI